jgi:hypothetical protein
MFEFISSSVTHSLPLTSLIWMSTENSSHEVFNSLIEVFFNYEPPTTAFRRELTKNSLRTDCETDFSLSYKPLIWHAKKQRSVLLRGTSWRSREPSLLLRDPVFTASPSNARGAARHGPAELGSAWRKHRPRLLLACFEVSVVHQFLHGINMPQYYYVLVTKHGIFINNLIY